MGASSKDQNIIYDDRSRGQKMKINISNLVPDTSESTPSDCSGAARWLLKTFGPLKVLEIGTSYGRQLPTFVGLASKTVCVDPMYDWVPDVSEADGFVEGKVDEAKLLSWKSFRDQSPGADVELVIGNSYLVHDDSRYTELFSNTDILIIDGCHHPREAVLKDFLNFRKHLSREYFIIWDDHAIMKDVSDAAVDVRMILAGEEGIEVREVMYNGCLIQHVFTSLQ